MSRQESHALRLRNCLFVLLLYIFAGSTGAQSSNNGIAPSGLGKEKSGQTMPVQSDGQFTIGKWTTGTRSIVTQKIPTWPRNEIYEFKFESGGAVFIRTKRRHKFNAAGSEGHPAYPRNQVPSEMRWLCKNRYGTDLNVMVTLPNMKKKLMALRGTEYLTNVIEAKCYTKSEHKERIERIYAEVKASREAAEAKRAEDKRIAEQRRVARADARRQRAAMILEERKAKCTSYGFIPNTDGHATCVMELAIADEANEQRQTYNAARATAIENQTAVAQAAADEARRQREAAADEARRQRQAQALINLGSAISSGGASGRSISTPTTAPLSSGRYKTCNYRVAGEIVPMTVGRAELCPARRSIAGQTGYLVR